MCLYTNHDGQCNGSTKRRFCRTQLCIVLSVKFRITEDEQRHLKTLVSKDIAKERDRERHTARRQAAGSIDRATYEANSLSRKKPWEALGMSRRTWYRAGKPMPTDSGTGPSVLLMAEPSRAAAGEARRAE